MINTYLIHNIFIIINLTKNASIKAETSNFISFQNNLFIYFNTNSKLKLVSNKQNKI